MPDEQLSNTVRLTRALEEAGFTNILALRMRARKAAMTAHRAGVPMSSVAVPQIPRDSRGTFDKYADGRAHQRTRHKFVVRTSTVEDSRAVIDIANEVVPEAVAEQLHAGRRVEIVWTE